MQHRFFALISRMRYIGRWGLMRNTFEENIQEHSHQVAVLLNVLPEAVTHQRPPLDEPHTVDIRKKVVHIMSTLLSTFHR